MSFQDELRKIPPVTRFLCGATLVVTLPVMLELVSIHKVLYHQDLVVRRHEYWRIPVSFFFGGKGIPFLFDMIMLYRNSSGLETTQYSRRSYDYAWQLFLGSLSVFVLNIPLQSYFHFRPLLTCLVYLSCTLEPNAIVSIFGLLQLPSKYFPYAMLAMDILSGGGPRAAIGSLTGMITGHAWYMLLFQRPDRRVPSWLRAPGWVKRFIGTGEAETQRATGTDARAYGAAAAPRGRTLGDSAGAGSRQGPTGGSSASGTTTGYRWGSGQRLGAE